MNFRWLTGDEIIEWVNPVCRARGWSELNVCDEQPTCRVLAAFIKDITGPIGWIALQMFPVIGPAFVENDRRDGVLSRELADRMREFLEESKARGALTICEGAVAGRLAERHKMELVKFPVYLWQGVK